MTRTILIAAALVALSYLASGPHFWRPMPAVAQGETKPVQDLLDQQRQTLLGVIAAVERLEAAKPANPATVTATELGCIPNDGRDDAPAMQAALDRMQNVELDATGEYELGAPLRFAPGQSNTLKGQSAGYRYNAAGRTGFKPLNESVSHLIEVPWDAAKSTGQVQVIRDLYLAGNDKCDGIRVLGCDALSIESVCIRKCKTGLLIAAPSRAYSPAVANSAILGCDVGIDIRNGTSVCCFTATGCEVFGGRIGLSISGWKRGAVFTGCVFESQSEHAARLEDARATFIGSYLECGAPVTTLWMKNSGATMIDSTCNILKHNAASRIDWIGENNRPYTQAYP